MWLQIPRSVPFISHAAHPRPGPSVPGTVSHIFPSSSFHLPPLWSKPSIHAFMNLNQGAGYGPGNVPTPWTGSDQGRHCLLGTVPSAPVPPVYLSDQLFANATLMLLVTFLGSLLSTSSNPMPLLGLPKSSTIHPSADSSNDPINSSSRRAATTCAILTVSQRLC